MAIVYETFAFSAMRSNYVGLQERGWTSLDRLYDDKFNTHILTMLPDSKIYNRNVVNWNTESHSSQFAIQGWDDLSNSLCSTSACRNDILSSNNLVTNLSRWSIHYFLGCCHCMNSGHETFNNSKVIMDDFCKRSKAVCGARGIGNHIHRRLIGFLVYTKHKHGCISTWG
ncbi:hypothetical protein J437_LFUL015711 [Ladona fulva]|uniref:Uncharacterized protein n=1 Tax=Ladona fulva TaxID=123851 RepID=A0A8K0P7W4_LADFU|nr:hypothetical protein J437_LFUL015711 [Ladona fulva]